MEILDTIEIEVCRMYNLDRTEIELRTKKRTVVEARKVFVTVAIRSALSRTSITSRLNISKGRITQILKETHKESRLDRVCQRVVDLVNKSPK